MGFGLISDTIFRVCPLCGENTSLTFDDEKILRKIEQYERHEIYVQDIPIPANQREFLKTGYCLECQKLLFGEIEEE